MCTIHANSAGEAVTKMCTLPLLAWENVGHAFVVPMVAGCIDLVVHIAIERDGRRSVREVVAVPGRVEGDVVEIARRHRPTPPFHRRLGPVRPYRVHPT